MTERTMRRRPRWNLTARIARVAFRHHWLTLLAVAGVVAASIAVLPNLANSLPNSGLVTINGSMSAETARLIRDEFQTSQETGLLLYQSPTLSTQDPAFAAVVNAGITKLTEAAPDLIGAANTPYNSPDFLKALLVAKDDHAALARVTVYGDATLVADAYDKLLAAAASASTPQVQVSFLAPSGVQHELVTSVGQQATQALEVAAIPIVVLLIIGVGSLGGLIPTLVSPILAMIVSLASLTLLGQALDIGATGLAALALVAIAVGIDNALFGVARFQAELRLGHAPVNAIAIVGHTNGRSAIKSALVAAIAMAPLLTLPATTYQSFAVAASVTLLVLALVNIVALPALLGALGRGLNFGRLPWSDRGDPSGWWLARLMRIPMSKPRISALCGLVILVLLAVPAASIRPTTGGIDLLPPGSPSRATATALAASITPGIVVPIDVVAASSQPLLDSVDAYRKTSDLQQRIAADPGTYFVSGPRDAVDTVAAKAPTLNPAMRNALSALEQRNLSALQAALKNAKSGDATPPTPDDVLQSQLAAMQIALDLLPGVGNTIAPIIQRNYGRIIVIGRAAPGTPEAETFVNRVRNDAQAVFGTATTRTGFDNIGGAFVGGMVASGMDVTATTRRLLAPVLGACAALLWVALLFALRSPKAATIAVVAELLATLAAFGVLVLVFQRSGQAIEAEIPMLLVPVLFALSTAYLVTLLERIRSVVVDTPHIPIVRTEMLRLVTRQARVGVVGSALLLFVFGSLALYGTTVLAQIGVAITALVVIDIVLVRGVLLPAAIGRFGARLWKLPDWLDDVLPGSRWTGRPLRPPAPPESEPPVAATGPAA